MRKILRAFSRDEQLVTQIDPVQVPIQELIEGYEFILTGLPEKSAAPLAGVDFRVHHSGTAPDGRPVILLTLKIVRWVPRKSVQVLLGLPLMERAVRRLLRGSWLLEVSHFGGVWIHTSSALDLEREHQLEIGTVLAGIRAEPAAASGFGAQHFPASIPDEEPRLAH